MQALRLVMLFAAVPLCYLMFFHSQPAGARVPAPEAQSDYLRDIDKVRAATTHILAQRAEADFAQE